MFQTLGSPSLFLASHIKLYGEGLNVSEPWPALKSTASERLLLKPTNTQLYQTIAYEKKKPGNQLCRKVCV